MDLLDRLIGHDAWTTRQFLLRCRDLSDEQLDREFDIGHRTVRTTLAHIIRNMEVWPQLMAGRQVKDCHGASVDELFTRFDRAAAELAAVTRNVAQRGAWDARFLDTLDKPHVEKTLGGGIVHLITHSMHHRAQILYMLRRLGVSGLLEGDALTWEQLTGGVYSRDVVEADLADFYEHQRDPVANQMAAFPPRDRDAFLAHWQKILADDTIVKCTIVLGSQIAGNVLCWQEEEKPHVGYWLGRQFWGQGIATRALAELVSSISMRPLYARVAKTNIASVRVLEKCGFRVMGESRAAAPTGGEAVEEFVYKLLP